MKQIWMVGSLILTCLAIGGCKTESERLADMSDRTVEMQSQQNTTIATANETVANLNRDVQAERLKLNQGFERLEHDRRELNKQRQTELVWAEAFQFLAIIIAATMPLFLCAYLIWAATRSSVDQEEVNTVLIHELVSAEPRLIAGPNLRSLEQVQEDEQRQPVDETKT